MNNPAKIALVAVALGALAAPVFANSDSEKIEALMRQIETLEARVKALEGHVTFTSFMPNLAERFHVMHRAGEAQDWAVAAHELAEMKRITALSPTVDLEQGKLMVAMMDPSFQLLDAAIEHGDHEKFEEALNQTINTCNSCHVATDSEFVQVTMDATTSLSMRHPHMLMKRGVQGGHRHGDDADSGMSGMMKMMPEADPDHNDTGKAPHEHATE